MEKVRSNRVHSVDGQSVSEAMLLTMGRMLKYGWVCFDRRTGEALVRRGWAVYVDSELPWYSITLTGVEAYQKFYEGRYAECLPRTLENIRKYVQLWKDRKGNES